MTARGDQAQQRQSDASEGNHIKSGDSGNPGLQPTDADHKATGERRAQTDAQNAQQAKPHLPEIHFDLARSVGNIGNAASSLMGKLQDTVADASKNITHGAADTVSDVANKISHAATDIAKSGEHFTKHQQQEHQNKIKASEQRGKDAGQAVDGVTNAIGHAAYEGVDIKTPVGKIHIPGLHDAEKHAYNTARDAGHALDHGLKSIGVSKEVRTQINDTGKLAQDFGQYMYGVDKGIVRAVGGMATGFLKSGIRATGDIVSDPIHELPKIVNPIGLLGKMGENTINDIGTAVVGSFQNILDKKQADETSLQRTTGHNSETVGQQIDSWTRIGAGILRDGVVGLRTQYDTARRLHDEGRSDQVGESVGEHVVPGAVGIASLPMLIRSLPETLASLKGMLSSARPPVIEVPVGEVPMVKAPVVEAPVVKPQVGEAPVSGPKSVTGPHAEDLLTGERVTPAAPESIAPKVEAHKIEVPKQSVPVEAARNHATNIQAHSKDLVTGERVTPSAPEFSAVKGTPPTESRDLLLDPNLDQSKRISWKLPEKVPQQEIHPSLKQNPTASDNSHLKARGEFESVQAPEIQPLPKAAKAQEASPRHARGDGNEMEKPNLPPNNRIPRNAQDLDPGDAAKVGKNIGEQERLKPRQPKESNSGATKVPEENLDDIPNNYEGPSTPRQRRDNQEFDAQAAKQAAREKDSVPSSVSKSPVQELDKPSNIEQPKSAIEQPKVVEAPIIDDVPLAGPGSLDGYKDLRGGIVDVRNRTFRVREDGTGVTTYNISKDGITDTSRIVQETISKDGTWSYQVKSSDGTILETKTWKHQ